MQIDPRRAEEDLETDLAKVRSTVRMRLGVVAGVVIVGLVQTNFDGVDGGGIFDAARRIFILALPVLGLGLLGALIVGGLAGRDIKRARARYDSKRFRVPTRKSGP